MAAVMSTGGVDREIPRDFRPSSDLQSLLEFFPWDAASKYNGGSEFDSLG